MLYRDAAEGRGSTFQYLGHEIRLLEDSVGYCYYLMKISGKVIRSHFYGDSPSALGAAKDWIDKHAATQADII
jgi:hypothetical protein